jgi:hypothetical protein
MNVHGRAAAEVGAVFERAGEVARQLESSVDLAPPLAGLWLFHLNRGRSLAQRRSSMNCSMLRAI